MVVGGGADVIGVVHIGFHDVLIVIKVRKAGFGAVFIVDSHVSCAPGREGSIDAIAEVTDRVAKNGTDATNTLSGLLHGIVIDLLVAVLSNVAGVGAAAAVLLGNLGLNFHTIGLLGMGKGATSAVVNDLIVGPSGVMTISLGGGIA